MSRLATGIVLIGRPVGNLGNFGSWSLSIFFGEVDVGVIAGGMVMSLCGGDEVVPTATPSRADEGGTTSSSPKSSPKSLASATSTSYSSSSSSSRSESSTSSSAILSASMTFFCGLDGSFRLNGMSLSLDISEDVVVSRLGRPSGCLVTPLLITLLSLGGTLGPAKFRSASGSGPGPSSLMSTFCGGLGFDAR